MIRRARWDRWRRVGRLPDPGPFLRAREPYCVPAAARFLQSLDQAWMFQDEEKTLRALLIHSKGSLFPVFHSRLDIPMPCFMEKFLKKTALHSVQGILREAEALESGLARFGAEPKERIDYDLMALDRAPGPGSLGAGPEKLVLRRAEARDMEALFQIQAAYEQEEILPQGAAFNPAACRRTLEHIAAKEHLLIAELEGRILGKINTNARSFSRYQIGGVYIRPEYRGLGVASRLIAVFSQSILAAGMGVSLFVKKRNHRAR
ncbi:MAG: GNAT family N-acetyltransferase, partial [Spirochaetaceae bacterium]|nr:GNAT family N-acetyltransferase [Spirochaetaceae bacterium]